MTDAESAATDVVTAATPGSPGGGGGGSSGGGGGGGGSTLATTVAVYINGADVTDCCLTGSVTRRLNRPAQATIRCSMDCAASVVGSRLRIDFNGSIWFHGFIITAETDTAEDWGYTTYNAQDPMELWQARPVRDSTGDFSKPDINNLDGPTLTGPSMVEAVLNNTVFAGAGPPSDSEGDIFLDMGTFAGGGPDLTGAPVDWPIRISDFVSLLCSTGQVDVIITPTDPGGGVMGTVDCYNGDYGTDLSGSISFDYGQGNYNVQDLRWVEDMSNMCNKLWYYMGPRVGTEADPAGDQHWCYNITGDDSGLPDPTPIRDSSGSNIALATLLSNRDSSRTTYGVRMDVQIFDAADSATGDCDPTGSGLGNRDLYRYRWEQESWLRQNPRTLIHVTPTRETEIATFDIGDLVGVTCTSAVRGGFSGAQRVYAYTIGWDGDGVVSLGELQTSADNDNG